MELHILKTNFRDEVHVEELTPVFNLHPAIYRWHVDIDDCDRILKIEARSGLSESELIQLLVQYGIKCEVLPD